MIWHNKINILNKVKIFYIKLKFLHNLMILTSILKNKKMLKRNNKVLLI